MLPPLLPPLLGVRRLKILTSPALPKFIILQLTTAPFTILLTQWSVWVKDPVRMRHAIPECPLPLAPLLTATNRSPVPHYPLLLLTLSKKTLLQ